MKNRLPFCLSIIVSLVFIIGIVLRAPSLLQPPLLFVEKTVSPHAIISLSPSNAALYQERIVSPIGLTKEVHAATLVENGQSQLLAFWYGGSREGAKDVAIFSAVLNEKTQSWEKSRPLFNRSDVEKDLGRYIKKCSLAILNRNDCTSNHPSYY